MNKIKWYRHKFHKKYCYVEVDNAFYLVNVYGSIIRGRDLSYNIEVVDENEILELREYKILKHHVYKLTSILYQELIK